MVIRPSNLDGNLVNTFIVTSKHVANRQEWFRAGELETRLALVRSSDSTLGEKSKYCKLVRRNSESAKATQLEVGCLQQHFHSSWEKVWIKSGLRGVSTIVEWITKQNNRLNSEKRWFERFAELERQSDSNSFTVESFKLYSQSIRTVNK